MTKDYRLVLSNTYGHPNVGDDAILTSMIERLSANLNAHITLLSIFEQRTSRIYPTVRTVKSGVLTGLPSTVRAIRDADLLIIGGGSIIQDLSSLGNLLFHLSRARIAERVGTPFMCYAVGIGPLRAKISRLITANTLKNAESILVRDKKSAMLLDDLGIRGEIVEVTADPALLLDFPTTTSSEELFRKLRRIKHSDIPVVGISLRPAVDGYRFLSRAPILSHSSEHIINLVAGISREVKRAWDAHIVFFSMHPDQDDHIGQFFIEKLDCPGNVTFVPGTLRPKDMLAAIGLADVFIGMRLHSLIFAARSSIPSIALSYSPKVSGFMELLQQGQFALSPSDWQHTHIVDLLELLRGDSGEIRQHIRIRVAELQKRAARNTEVVRQLLEGF